MALENTKNISCKAVAGLFPGGLLEKLAEVHAELPGDLYMTGGTVRDLLLGRQSADIDLTVVHRAKQWADRLADCCGGTYVELGREEDAARMVWQGVDVDFSSFREGASSIDEELHKRDITVNSMALPIHGLLLDPTCRKHETLPVIDPVGGIRDLDQQLVRITSKHSFHSDPLRMLRVFRFAAVLGFSIDSNTLHLVHLHRQEIERVSPERVAHELDLIMASGRAHWAFTAMRDCGLLWEILPELQAGVGMVQPASHHLEVFDHCLETLHQMELVLADPGSFFPGNREVMEKYLQPNRRLGQLKWAALFHDVGKPATYGINEDKGGRITFYNHDLQGADIFTGLARRLRWSGADTTVVVRLIRGHMRPFFLANNQRQGTLTLKACLRLVKSIAEHLPGLFLLAMADALAGKGEGSPEAIEREVAGLFDRMYRVEQENVAPVRSALPLITGNDLIKELHLKPGPEFRRILAQVEEAHMENTISTRKQALALARSEAGNQKPETRSRKTEPETRNPKL
jgi:poly(A) polymerase